MLTKIHRVKALPSPVVMNGYENWTIKKAECQRTDAFKLWCWRRLWVPWTARRPNPVNRKGSQPCIFIGRTDAEAEAPILWPPDAKSWLIGKDLDAGKGWRQEEKVVTEEEMVGWHHWLNGHEFQKTPVVKDREAWCAAVRGITKTQTQLSDWTTTKQGGMCGWSRVSKRRKWSQRGDRASNPRGDCEDFVFDSEGNGNHQSLLAEEEHDLTEILRGYYHWGNHGWNARSLGTWRDSRRAQGTSSVALCWSQKASALLHYESNKLQFLLL